MTNSANAAATRRCERCGVRLSRYNNGNLCASCGSVAIRTAAEQATDSPWLSHRERITATDDPGAVLRAWRTDNKQSQADVAAALEMTQQHLSQIEKGKRPFSLEQRRRAIERLGLAPEELGLSSGAAGHMATRDDESPEVASSQVHWRGQRRWLNQHRSALAELAVQLYPAEHRIPGTPLITHPDWLIDEPIDLQGLRLTLDEGSQAVTVDASEDESLPTRPLHSPSTHFDRYSSAIKHVDPPRLFESRPSYRLLSTSLSGRQLRFGLAAYFDKLDISETLGHDSGRVHEYGPRVAVLARRAPRQVALP